MITMRIKGGLGNQLFQYSAAYSLSERLLQPFQFNPSFTENMTPRLYRLSSFNVISSSVISDSDLPKIVRFIKNKYVNKVFRVLKKTTNCWGDYLYLLESKNEWIDDFYDISAPNVYVDGYFQSENYFKQYRNKLLKQFTPNYEPERDFSLLLNEILSVNSVAVHVRRSDFKKDNTPYHYLLDTEYYMKGIEFIRNRINSPVFFWFSDDIDWVKSNIGISNDFVFTKITTTHPDIDDLMLMKNCNHIITANSTFSWWAAWLNEHDDAIRIVPQKPFGMKEMIPDSWIKI